MTWLHWLLIALGALLAGYAGFVACLVRTGRREDARAVAGFIPDCVVLFRRVLGDDRVPRPTKALLVALVGYLVMPFDLVPDFIPVAGQLDDAIVVRSCFAGSYARAALRCSASTGEVRRRRSACCCGLRARSRRPADRSDPSHGRHAAAGGAALAPAAGEASRACSIRRAIVSMVWA